MIHYSTNWMGPIATRWYEERNIPYVLKKTSGKILPAVEYKDFTESYSCGRIDIYGLDESEYWGGKSEYGVPVMKTESWNLLSDYLNDYESSELVSYEDLIEDFETRSKHKIEWWVENKGVQS
tara:strand:+ start:4330 stop:4698 length:369 start_codon:yes stop_codon:yes gene_type:complete